MEEDEAAVVEGRDPEMPLLKRRLQDALNGYTTASQLPFLSTRNIDSDSAAIRMRNRALCDALILQMESDDVVAVEDRDPGMPLLKRRLQDALDGYNPNDAMNMT